MMEEIAWRWTFY